MTSTPNNKRRSQKRGLEQLSPSFSQVSPDQVAEKRLKATTSTDEEVLLPCRANCEEKGDDVTLLEGHEEEEEEEQAEQVTKIGKDILAQATELKDKNGREIARLFLVLPSRKFYPDYYEIIKQPLAFDTIKKKLSKSLYPTFQDLKSDFELLFSNAKIYNMPGSEIYKDANRLQRFVNSTLQHAIRRLRQSVSFSTVPEAPIVVSELPPPSALSTVPPPPPPPPEVEKPVTPAPLPTENTQEDLVENVKKPKIKLKLKLFPPNIPSTVNSTSLEASTQNSENLITPEVKKTNEPRIKLKLRPKKVEDEEESAADEEDEEVDVDETSKKGGGLTIKSRKVPRFLATKPLEEKDYQRLCRLFIKSDYKVSALIVEENPHFEANRLFSHTLKIDIGDGFRDEEFKWTALHCAAHYGRVKAIEMLISKGANVEAKDTWYESTPLAHAAYCGHYEAAKLLVEKYGADKFSKNKYGQIPWDVLSFRRDSKWIELLRPLKRSASPAEEPASPVLDVTRSVESNSAIDRGLAPKVSEEEQIAREAAIKNQRRLRKALKDWYSLLTEHVDNRDHLLAEMFMELPSREDYPDYYELINHPISFEEIFQKVKKESVTMAEFEEDCETMFRNAMQYNEIGSQIYRDAQNLLRLLKKSKDVMFQRADPNYKRDKATAAAIAAAVSATNLSGTGGNAFGNGGGGGGGGGAANYVNMARKSVEEGQIMENSVMVYKFNGVEYGVGDFVYINDNQDIVMIRKIQQSDTEETSFLGVVFLKPHQVIALKHRKVMEREVYRTATVNQHQFGDIRKKCFVMFYKDYISHYPEGYLDEDVYPCACRFAETARRQFPYIGDWRRALGVDAVLPVRLVPRAYPIQVTRHRPDHLSATDAVESDEDEPPPPPKKVRSIRALGQSALDVNRQMLGGVGLINGSAAALPAPPVQWGPLVTPGMYSKPEISSTFRLPRAAAAAAANSFKAPEPLPSGTKLIREITVDDNKGSISLQLAASPEAHSLDVSDGVDRIRITARPSDMSSFGPTHSTALTTFYVYLNAKRIDADPRNPCVFWTELVAGLNVIELWVTHQPQLLYVPPSSGYQLRGQSLSSLVPQESQQYILFVVKH